jgi:NADH:ubiquinone oxidoreductase subunit
MLKFLTTVQSSASIRLATLFGGKRVGEDSFGNVYYSGKPRRGTKRERRWVIFKGEPEATTVPPEWHGWLHHQTDHLPTNDNPLRRDWQKPYVPNLTGTPNAYVPPGHISRGAQRDKATGDYEAWTPPQS